MRTVTGIFPSVSEAACAAERLLARLDRDRVNLLTRASEIEQVPTHHDMAPVGGAIAGTILGALGTAVALSVPGVGAVTAFGAAAAALFGAGGAALGWAIGDAADRTAFLGLPVDELHVYEDALRDGRSVVFALTETQEEEDEAHRILDDCGAESLDAARQKWWLGLRDAEAETYDAPGADFARDEESYRRGFELALSPWARGHDLSGLTDLVRERGGGNGNSESFRRGFERGRQYLDRWQRAGV